MALLLPAPARGQDDFAWRLVENGDRLARDGKNDQALAAWNEVLECCADSPAAPEALLRLAGASYPADSFADRGASPPESLERARSLLENLTRRYRTAPAAPHALFRLGLLYTDPAAAFRNLDEAYAAFSGLITLYPGSDYADEGLFGMAEVLAAQQAWERALIPIADLTTFGPRGPLRGEAWSLGATCLIRLHRLEEALAFLQAARDSAPEGPVAGPARDRILHLIRLGAAPGLKKSSAYASFDVLRLVLPEESRIRSVAGMAAGVDGRLAVADEKGDAVHILDAGGVPVERIVLPRPSAVWLGSTAPLVGSGADLFSGDRQIPLVGRSGPATLKEIGFVGRDASGGIVIWDRKTGEVRRLRSDLMHEKTLSAAGERTIDDVALSSTGAVYALQGKERRVELLAGPGAPRSIPVVLPDVIPRPDRLALDFLDNLFVLDRDARGVGVFDGAGRVLAQVASGSKAEDPFPRPLDLAVNGRGEILIYDERHQGIVRLR
jgi:TolA-binding protein